MNKELIEKAVEQYLEKNRYERMQLRAAMFDMDGVLFDSMKNHAKCWHETMAHFGMNLPEWEAYMHEGRTGAGTVNIVSIRERGVEASPDEIERIYQYKSNLFNRCPRAERMPGAYELLQQVKASGVVPMVVTGSGQKTLLQRLQNNFPEIFHQELMVTAYDVKFGKPNPEPYLMGMEKYRASLTAGASVAPNNFIVVENAPLGVQAGVAAGVFTIAVNTGPLPDETLLNQGAHLLFHSMQEFADHWSLVVSVLKNQREKNEGLN